MRSEPELLHELLPRLREERGLSQSALSHRTAIAGNGVGESTIQSYEKAAGRGTVPKAHILQALADALEVDPSVFYEWPLAKAQAERPARGATPRPLDEIAAEAGRQRTGKSRAPRKANGGRPGKGRAA